MAGTDSREHRVNSQQLDRVLGDLILQNRRLSETKRFVDIEDRDVYAHITTLYNALITSLNLLADHIDLPPATLDQLTPEEMQVLHEWRLSSHGQS